MSDNAFPDKMNGGREGLTKRELFAALAMQGYITGCYAGDNVGFTVGGHAVAAVEAADALIAALATPVAATNSERNGGAET